jgi:pSer/pThr/pTyr-binding forkhead associated (FHA) protein
MKRLEKMDDNNNKPAEKSENMADNPVPENAFLIREGVKAIPLNKVHITIGRSHDNKIVVDDPRVSRHHAEIRVIRGNFVLFDLNSSGGSYVNGQRASQGILYPGDLISLAGVSFIFTQDTRLISRGTDTLPVGPGDRHTAIFRTPKSANAQEKNDGSETPEQGMTSSETG